MDANDVEGQIDELLPGKHGAELLTYLERMTGSRHVAQAIARSTYAMTLNGLTAQRELGRALLFDVARRLALEHLQRVRAGADLEDVSGISGLAAVLDIGERHAQWVRQRAEFPRNLEALPEQLRQVLVRRYGLNQPRAQIAQALDLPLEVIDQRLTQALSQCHRPSRWRLARAWLLTAADRASRWIGSLR